MQRGHACAGRVFTWLEELPVLCDMQREHEALQVQRIVRRQEGSAQRMAAAAEKDQHAHGQRGGGHVEEQQGSGCVPLVVEAHEQALVQP